MRTESGLAGSIVQDVITEPAQKRVRVQGDTGFVEWYVNSRKNQDCIVYGRSGGAAEREEFEKTRPDDFRYEIDHVERLSRGSTGRRSHRSTCTADSKRCSSSPRRTVPQRRVSPSGSITARAGPRKR